MSAFARKPISGPSREEADEACGHAYKLRYVNGIRTEDDFANLVFGESVHHAVESYLIADLEGRTIDAEERFQAKFEALASEKIVAYSSIWNEEEMIATGRELMRQFPEFWGGTGLIVLSDAQGPLIERMLEVEFEDFVLRIKMDLIALHVETGRVVVVDTKTPAEPSLEGFEHVAEQLTDYNIAVDAHAEALGFDRVGALAFMEGIKKKMPKTRRGSGPYWRMSDLAPARSPELIAERIEKHRRMIRNHAQGWFPHRPRMAFNSPCKLCSLRNYCFYGKTDGLVIPARAANASTPAIPALVASP